MMSFLETFELLLSKLETPGNRIQLLSIIEGIRETNHFEDLKSNLIDYRKETKPKINELKQLMIQLDAIKLYTELEEMKVYYQVNTDPRSPNTQSLYAKAVTPKFGKNGKRKHIGIRYGSLNKYPEGWTKKHMTEAKSLLIKKALSQILEE